MREGIAMKIIDVKTFIAGNKWKNWAFLKIYTDEGLTGVGEITSGLQSGDQLITDGFQGLYDGQLITVQ